MQMVRCEISKPYISYNRQCLHSSSHLSLILKNIIYGNCCLKQSTIQHSYNLNLNL